MKENPAIYRKRMIPEECVLLKDDILLEVNDDIIEMLGTIVEYRNLENRSHIKKVSGFTEILVT